MPHTGYMSSYDSWLEKPYRDRAAQDAFCEQAIERYAAHYDMDESEVDEATAFEWYSDGLAEAAEDAAIARYESEREDPYFDRYDDIE